MNDLYFKAYAKMYATYNSKCYDEKGRLKPEYMITMDEMEAYINGLKLGLYADIRYSGAELFSKTKGKSK